MEIVPVQKDEPEKYLRILAKKTVHLYFAIKQVAMNFSFFGTPEHRVFNYKPRYYDPEKEALKEKFGKVDGRFEKEKYVPGSYIKGSFRNGNYQKTRGANKVQKIIGAIALVIFFIVLVYIAKFYSLLWQ